MFRFLLVSPNNVLQNRCAVCDFLPTPVWGGMIYILVMIMLAFKINHSCVSYENFLRERECDIHKAAEGICVLNECEGIFVFLYCVLLLILELGRVFSCHKHFYSYLCIDAIVFRFQGEKLFPNYILPLTFE